GELSDPGLLAVLGDGIVPGLEGEGVGEPVQRLVDDAHVVAAPFGAEAGRRDVSTGERRVASLVGGAGAGEGLVDLAHVVSDAEARDSLERCAHRWILPRAVGVPL